MKIAINIPILGKEEISAVTNILKNGALTSSASQGGKHVQDFERTAASFVKSKYAIAVNSGTSALQAALHALDIKKGDEILVPSFTFVATKVNDGTKISSPFLISNACRAACRADVPEFTAIAYFDFTKEAAVLSKS